MPVTCNPCNYRVYRSCQFLDHEKPPSSQRACVLRFWFYAHALWPQDRGLSSCSFTKVRSSPSPGETFWGKWAKATICNKVYFPTTVLSSNLRGWGGGGSSIPSPLLASRLPKVLTLGTHALPFPILEVFGFCCNTPSSSADVTTAPRRITDHLKGLMQISRSVKI